MLSALIRRPRTGRHHRSERGVAAVEAGLITMFLSPFLGGVLWFGNYFWQQQEMYEPTVTQTEVVGVFGTCQDLVGAVKGSVLTNVNNVSGSTGIDLDDIAVTVVDFVPDQIGVDVHISVRVPMVGTMASWLPDDGDVVSEAIVRLENVRLTVASC